MTEFISDKSAQINHTLNIVQINMGRCAIANDQLLSYCVHKDIDLVLIQEPYVRHNRLIGFESPSIRYHLSAPSYRHGNNSKIYGAAIAILNSSLRCMVRNELCNENMVVIAIEADPNVRITAISSYFKFRIPTAVHINNLKHTLEKLDGEIIIGMDANASSTLWFNEVTNRKGEQVEELITESELTILNRKVHNFTFVGPRGHTNIDLTLATSDLANRITGWDVIPNITSSDHNLISFQIMCDPLTNPMQNRRFDTRHANWPRFLITLTNLLSTDRDQFLQKPPNIRAILLTDAITKAATESIPKRKAFVKTRPPWWTPELESCRRELRAAARGRWTLLGDGDGNAAYRTARNKFTAQLRKDKMASWRSFCTVNGKKPWGRVYKWLRKGPATHAIPNAFKNIDGTFSSSMDIAATVILEHLIPNNPEDIQRESQILGNYPYVKCTADELKTSIWKISPKKAPGNDKITGDIVRKAWPVIAEIYLDIVNDALRLGVFPDCWKIAEVIPIIKAADADPAVP